MRSGQLNQNRKSTKFGNEIKKIDLYFSLEGRGGTPYNSLNGEAPPKRGIFFSPQVYERVGISLLEVYDSLKVQNASVSPFGPLDYHILQVMKSLLFHIPED